MNIETYFLISKLNLNDKDEIQTQILVLGAEDYYQRC